MSTLAEIATELKNSDKKIHLIYAFNGTGKTRLSSEYCKQTEDDRSRTGVFYNAQSEDLFQWCEVEVEQENGGTEIEQRINIVYAKAMNDKHSDLQEQNIRDKLKAYNLNFDFSFETYKNIEDGIDTIKFYLKGDQEQIAIKISRGEERLFVWGFMLAMFDLFEESEFIFIDDPVSSLDDYNIYVTAFIILGLISEESTEKKIIITTHHVGLFSILADWLTKGEKADTFKPMTELRVLSKDGDELSFVTTNKANFLTHLHLLKILKDARDSDSLQNYHFSLLRQVLENIASFSGRGQFGFVLDRIGINDPQEQPQIINALSHQRVYYSQMSPLVPDNKHRLENIIDKLFDYYEFKIS